MRATEADPDNILLTGLARSGTTLTCHLLNKLPNCVALHEPIDPRALVGLAPADLIAKIGHFFDEQRAIVRRDCKATSKSTVGRVPTNSIGDPDKSGVRKSLSDGKEIRVDNVTAPTFRMFIKHPAIFTAALPVLVEGYQCHAIVRNPLAVLLSWRSSSVPVAEGRVPAAEMYDTSLAAALSAEDDTLERQFIWLDYCFARYLDCIPRSVLRYEDIIRTRGSALSMLDPVGRQLDEPLTSRNTLFIRHDPKAKDIARRLLDRDSPCWKVYDRKSVEALFEQA
ncbi:MAG: hypothetical protein FGM40_01275 [Rhodocyclaceae bacterium]|nr:hypothetical protein [Rhodocyclaceae bacterium]